MTSRDAVPNAEPSPGSDAGPDAAPEERVSASFHRRDDDPPLILRGGKVNPEAVRLAYQRAAESGDADETDPLWRVTFTLQRDLKTRLDKYLTSRVAFMSRSQLQRLIAGGGVEVNGRPARPATQLRAGDTVAVVVPPPPSDEILPQPLPLDILLEDEHLLVLNKRPGVIVHPARAEKSGTLINGLAWHFKHAAGAGGGAGGGLSPVGADDARPGVVHRLDRDTTGCIVFAKTEEAHWKLGAQFEKRTVDKRYLAVTHGFPPADTLTIDDPIGPHPSREKGLREKHVVRRDDLGKPSLTVARVRERYTRPAVDADNRRTGERDFALVELELKTGRTHQIRVHLSSRDLPIVGDGMYGGRPLALPGREPIARQMLHAALLAFEHPIEGRPVAFTAPPPEDFAALVAALRAEGATPAHVPGTVPLTRLGL